MTLENFIILPHQLFALTHLPNKNKFQFHLIEHPYYFTRLKFNKKKLVLHRASMQYYYDLLKKKGYHISYHQFDSNINSNIHFASASMFDPIDKDVKLNIKHLEILDTPNFLMSRSQLKTYNHKTKHLFHHHFYEWCKKELHLLPGISSKDKENRLKIPNNVKIPKLPSNKNNIDQKYIKEAIIYVNKHFPHNYGTTDNFEFPVTHNSTKKWLTDFLKNKFKNFGPYQDAIKNNKNFLFHSALSPMINIGLLNPSEIITAVSKYKNKVPINSYEGYVRQLFWREYVRYGYVFAESQIRKNYFNHHKKLNKNWYHATTHIPPLDDVIKRAWQDGYIHHIERLMVICNYMNLDGIQPSEVFKWFMEFSCDSYEWVMVLNVYSMGLWADGGIAMRRPYISSSNYILKMSDYPKGEWCQKWDDKYHHFLQKHSHKLKKVRYYYRTS